MDNLINFNNVVDTAAKDAKVSAKTGQTKTTEDIFPTEQVEKTDEGVKTEVKDDATSDWEKVFGSETTNSKENETNKDTESVEEEVKDSGKEDVESTEESTETDAKEVSTDKDEIDYKTIAPILATKLGLDKKELAGYTGKEIYESVIQKEAEELIEDKISSLPQELRDMNKFVLNGGTIQEFISNTKPEYNDILSKVDMENENHKEQLVRMKLKDEGYDDNLINEQINFFKEKGSFDLLAERQYEKIQREEEQVREELLKAQEQEKIERLEEEKKFKSDVYRLRGTMVGGTKMTEKKLVEYYKYITKRDDTGSTPLVEKLKEVVNDPKKAMQLTDILINDFDFTKYERRGETKANKKIIRSAPKTWEEIVNGT